MGIIIVLTRPASACLLCVIFLGLGENRLSGASHQPITLESLLLEMADRDAVARWPDPPYSCQQTSSWDRDSKAPDQPGWFANIDSGQYIRSETNGGRLESVMMDAAGPGSIVRWWAGGTTPQMGRPRSSASTLTGLAHRFSKAQWMR
jgi:hypothetical protein